MRRKPVPPVPDDPGYVHDVRAAVSLVPRDEESCCVRLMDRAGVPAEDEAKAWLTFLAALGLAEEVEGKFVRTTDPDSPDRDALAERFRDGVYGVRELEAILADSGDALDPEAAFEAFRDHVPRWERQRSDTWERTWRTRVRRILEWGVLLGEFERTGDEYAVRAA